MKRLSLTAIVIVEAPYCPQAGAIETLREVPVPPGTIFVFVFGTKIALDEVAETVRVLGNSSPTVKVNGVGVGVGKTQGIIEAVW